MLYPSLLSSCLASRVIDRHYNGSPGAEPDVAEARQFHTLLVCYKSKKPKTPQEQNSHANSEIDILIVECALLTNNLIPPLWRDSD